MRSAMTSDGGGRDRILAAALTRFAADGISGATVRAIAAEADVSPALVLHHFGSKAGLRAACDEHVRTTIREGKEKVMAAGGQADAYQALQMAQERLPLMRYLAQVLATGGPEAATLFDEMVADAEVYVQQAIDDGMMHAPTDLHPLVVVLTTWQLGALVLHDHVDRQLGADLTGDLAGIGAWMVPAGAILSSGVMTDQGRALLEGIRDAMNARDVAGASGSPAPLVDPTDRNDPADPTAPDPPRT